MTNNQNSRNVYCGIDPGLTGAIAFVVNGTVVCVDMPVLNKRLDVAVFKSLLLEHQPVLVALEQVSIVPSARGAKSSTTFMQFAGELSGVIQALELPLTRVAPITWKAAMKLNVPKNGMSDAQHLKYKKGLALEKACNYYPGLRSALPKAKERQYGWADAVLIAHYASIQGRSE